MKRVALSLFGTIAGLVALLDFKSHGQPIRSAGPLPSAALPSATTGQPTGGGSATPAPNAGNSPVASSQTADGDAVETRYGIVQVQVTVSGTKIENVKLLQLTAFDGRSAEINSQAAPILVQETISAQSAQIDTVSGATYTSDGYLQSLQSALDRAGFR